MPGSANGTGPLLNDCGTTSRDAKTALLSSAAEPANACFSIEALHLGLQHVEPYLSSCSGLTSGPSISRIEALDDSVDPPHFWASSPPNLVASLHALDLNLRQLSSKSSSGSLLYKAHVDGGSQATTTHHKELIWDLKPFPPGQTPPKLQVADTNAHHPVGIGFLRLPIHGSTKPLMVETFFTPTLPATILSPARLGRQHGFRGYSIVAFFHGGDSALKFQHPTHAYKDIIVPLSNHG